MGIALETRNLTKNLQPTTTSSEKITDALNVFKEAFNDSIELQNTKLKIALDNFSLTQVHPIFERP